MTPAILDHLWQSTVLAIGLGLLTLAFRKAPAGVRYGLWLAASIKFLVPFAALAALGRSLGFAIRLPERDVPAVLIRQAAEPFSQVVLLQTPHPQAPLPPAAAALTPVHAVASAIHPAPHPDWSLILMAVWALGSVAFAVCWMIRWNRLSRIVRSAQPLPWPAPMRVLASSSLLEPGLVGLWRPVLLVPETLPRYLSQVERSAIVAHEACHLRRRDNLTAAIHMLVEALFWFHPLVWWIGGRLIAERERACDEAVIAIGHDRATYARSLIESCRLYLQSPLDCVAGASGSSLKTRVEAIMTAPPALPLSRARKVLLLAAGAFAFASPVAAGLLTTPAAQKVVARASAIAAKAVSADAAPEAGSPDAGPGPKLVAPSRNELILTPGGSNGPVNAALQALPRVVAPTGIDPPPAHASSGTEGAVRNWIMALQVRQPALVKMSPAVEDAARTQWPLTVQMFRAFGALKAVKFVRVTPEGDDAYEADFAHGKIQVMVGPLTAEGELSRLAWGPIWDQDLRGDAVRQATPQATGVKPPIYRWGAPAPRAEAAPMPARATALRPDEIRAADTVVRAQVARWNESRWSLTSADSAAPAEARSQASAFVQSFAGALWNNDDPICIRVEGLPSDKAAAVKARVAADARAAGLSVGRAECGLRNQVEIRFAADAERAVRDVINYYHQPIWPFPMDRPAGAERPIRVWYGLVYDHAGAPDGQGGGPNSLGADPGAPKKFALAIVVVDPAWAAARDLDLVSDYVTMLALSQPRTLDACNVLPSVADLFAGACPDRAAPAGLTAADTAYLKALYTGSPGIRARRYRSELLDHMAKLLISGRRTGL